MFKFVAPGYMKTLGGSIVAGREFTWDDAHGRRPVAMVSANLARERWGGPSQAIGKRIRPYAKGVWREVVGVVSDTRDDGVTKKAADRRLLADLRWRSSARTPDEPPFALRSASYLVRSERTGSDGLRARAGAGGLVGQPEPAAGQRADAAGDLRRVAGADVVHAGDARRSPAAMALLLGVAGIYGVISYAVSQRRREIGIRIALGAPSHAVTGLFVGHGMVLAGIGVGIGLAAAFGVDAADGVAAVRNQPGRSADLRAGVADAVRRDGAGVLPAGPARDARRSDRRAPGG